MYWYLEVLRKYAVFTGRAQRKEYWMFVLFNFIIVWVLWILEGLAGGPGVLPNLYNLAVLLPSLAVTVRRLHDIDRTGWWILIVLIPIIGFIVLLVFMVQDSQEGENEYGPNPKVATA